MSKDEDKRTLTEKISKRLDNAYDIALPLRRMAKLAVATKALGVLKRQKDPEYAKAMKDAEEIIEADLAEGKHVTKNTIRNALGMKEEPTPNYDWSKLLRGDAEPIDGSGVKPVDGFKKGGKVSSASKRGDGIAKRGKTRGRYL